MSARECTTADRIEAVRNTIRSIGSLLTALIFAAVGVLNLLWVAELAHVLDLGISLVWVFVISMAIGPIALLAGNWLASLWAKRTAKTNRDQLLYRFPGKRSRYTSDFREMAVEVADLSKKAESIGHSKMSKGQIDAVSGHLRHLIDYLVDARGLAGHNPLAEEAFRLGEAVPVSLAHLAKEYEAWVETYIAWRKEYRATLAPLSAIVSALELGARVEDFSTRAANAKHP